MSSSPCPCRFWCEREENDTNLNWCRKRRKLKNDYGRNTNYHNYYQPDNTTHHPQLSTQDYLSGYKYGDFKGSDMPHLHLPTLSCAKIQRKNSILGNNGGINFSITSLLFIFLTIVSSTVHAYPTNDCDWSGRGTPENVVQAIYLRCQQGQILWEAPKGGLRVKISPPKYFSSSLHRQEVQPQPFRLCLESSGDSSNFKVFLEQSNTERKLLPFISPKKSFTCYRISSQTATLYVESQSIHEVVDEGDSSKDAYPVKISYEIEELKKHQEGFSDDECRPCSEKEFLQMYCVADVVAQGEILGVHPSSQKPGFDTLHIKSKFVLHQNHQVFQPLKPGNKNLQKFLSQEIKSFDQDAPKKVLKSGKSSYYGGMVSHPSKCAAQTGPGQFLWLIKLSFGKPKIGCVMYWDNWVKLAKEAMEDGRASCSLTY